MSLENRSADGAPTATDELGWVVEGLTIVIPPFSAEQTRYLDERRRLASQVDEFEAIGGCSDRRASLDRPRYT